MDYENKSKRELIEEIERLRKSYDELEVLEKQLEKKTRQFSTLIENLPGMGYTCLNDEDWTMVFVSKGCEDLTGYKPKELIGSRRTSYNNVIHTEDREYVWNQVQRAVERKKSFRLLYRITTSDNEEKWVWEKGMGVFDNEGNLLSLQGFIHDIRG